MKAINQPLEFYLGRASEPLREKMLHSIDLLRKSESLAKRYAAGGFYLAFSGGKDSQALYHITELAGVAFEAEMSLTSVDHPEVVRFIRRNYPEVHLVPPRTSMFKLIPHKGVLPTRIIRYCCAILKEPHGEGRVVLTGVRKAESTQRSKRGEVEVSNHRFSGNLDTFADWQEQAVAKKMAKGIKHLNQDQFAEQGETQVRCINGKDKIIVNPIIEWSDAEVWEFLNDVVGVPHCELYDNGYTRIGCILCPMSNLATKQRFIRDYPKMALAYKRAIREMLKVQPRTGEYLAAYVTDPDELVDRVFDWWISGLSWPQYIAKNFLQGELDLNPKTAN